jgi:catechol 2,3-dioxygenase-like lactoylglutathione lyase family enzyme
VYRVHHVQMAIPVGGEDDARAFYGDVLGFEEVPKPTALAARGGAWFRMADLEVHVGIDRDFVPARKAHPAFLVDDLDALAARLEDAGVEVRPDGLFPGYRRFYVEDPFGNRIEFLQPDG